MSSKNNRFPPTALLVLIVGLIAVVMIVLFSFFPLLNPSSTVNSFDKAKTLADQYVTGVDSGLEIKEIEEWTNNFYVRVQEKSTGINAFELLVDRYSSRVTPEPGPNMMWNEKYGMMGGMMGGFMGMMGGYQGMMGSLGVPFGFIGSLSLAGLVTGIIIIISASMLSMRPTEHMAWGIIILIFSIISFIDMGGFMLGAILGITGGALAISCRSINKTGDN